MSTTTNSPAATASGSTDRPRRRSLPVVGLAAGLGGGLAALAVAALGRAAEVPVAAEFPGSDGVEPIPLPAFLVSALIWTLVGTVLAAVVRARAARPARTFTIAAVVLAVLSLLQPLTADTDAASIVVLMLTHVAAAAVAIPLLARALPPTTALASDG